MKGWESGKEERARYNILILIRKIYEFTDYTHTHTDKGFAGGSDIKEYACNAGDPGSIPGLVISPGEWNGYPLQYSCLENSMDRRAWWATVHVAAKCWT